MISIGNTQAVLLFDSPHLSVLQSSICIIGKILPIYLKGILIN